MLGRYGALALHAWPLRGARPGCSQSLTVAQGKQQLLTEVCGTPDYFAPELVALAQRQQQRVEQPAQAAAAAALLDGADGGGGTAGYGPPLDCWAVGCIVYELLAGNPPYQAQDEQVAAPPSRCWRLPQCPMPTSTSTKARTCARTRHMHMHMHMHDRLRARQVLFHTI